MLTITDNMLIAGLYSITLAGHQNATGDLSAGVKMLTVTGNRISECRYGLHSMYSENAVFDANQATSNLLGAALMTFFGYAVSDLTRSWLLYQGILFVLVMISIGEVILLSSPDSLSEASKRVSKGASGVSS